MVFMSSYNVSMVIIYVFVITVAFVVCLIISNKLDIYNNRVAVMKEIAASEDIRGTDDEQ